MLLRQSNVAEFVRWCMKNNDMHRFYTAAEWLRVRAGVLSDAKNECQKCKARGYYRKATDVHHVMKLQRYPELGLSKHYIDDKGNTQIQLLALCFDCHQEEDRPAKALLNDERWD